MTYMMCRWLKWRVDRAHHKQTNKSTKQERKKEDPGPVYHTALGERAVGH